MAREINTLRKASEEITTPGISPEQPTQVWKPGRTAFDLFFSHFGPDANAAFRLAELDSFEGEIRPSTLRAHFALWQKRLRQANREKAEMRSLLNILPSENRTERDGVKATLNGLKEEVERCNKVLHATEKLQGLHRLFTANVLRYQRYLIDDLAYELRANLPVQISENAERAIDRWFIADGDLAESFLKGLRDTSLPEPRLEGAAAQLERMATSRLAPGRRLCNAFSQLAPRP